MDSLLRDEYDLTLEGYKYRDQLIPQEFFHMVQVFSALLLLMTASRALGGGLGIFLSAFLAIVGITALGGFLLDLEANISCKRVLRKRAAEIEESCPGLKYWQTINSRAPYFHEKNFRRIPDWMRRWFGLGPSASDGFLFAARFLFYLWFVLSAVIAIVGNTLGK
jgi:hypothetical protein